MLRNSRWGRWWIWSGATSEFRLRVVHILRWTLTRSGWPARMPKKSGKVYWLPERRPVGSDALEMYRIVRGVPRYGMDLRERDLPQETGQEHALNFTKGCFIGQEIVERIRARGNVHRTFLGFEAEGESPQPGTKVRANDKDVGEITSAARVPFPGGERTLALGYLRREVAAPDAEVQVGEQSARVRMLPFDHS